MANVRNRERPIRIWFGGACGNPIACLKNENTIMIRVNDVALISRAGMKVNTVTNNMSLTGVASPPDPSIGIFRDIEFELDAGADCANTENETTATKPNVNRNRTRGRLMRKWII